MSAEAEAQENSSGENAHPSLEPGDWGEFFQAELDGHAHGYAYAIARDGLLVEGTGVGLARSQHERANPGLRWSLDRRVNLASVSKPVTAVAVLTLIEAGCFSLDDPFIPLLGPLGWTHPDAGRVTIRDLLQMRSGLAPDASLDSEETIRGFLASYLQNMPVAAPGAVYSYSNTNFTILQAVIEAVVDCAYVDYVTRAVLAPMGIDPKRFNACPEAEHAATLGYATVADRNQGQYWPPIPFTATGGWIAPACELIKFLVGLRHNAVLSAGLAETMFSGQLGWYCSDGPGGNYYYHDGELVNDAEQWIHTAVVHFPGGYDAVLLANSPLDTIPIMVRAFDSVGVQVHNP